MLFHYAHDARCAPDTPERIFSSVRPGAVVALAGIKTVPPWLVPLNLWARLRGWRYRTSDAHLDAPWRPLARRVRQLEVEMFLLGTAFVASGRVHDA